MVFEAGYAHFRKISLLIPLQWVSVQWDDSQVQRNGPVLYFFQATTSRLRLRKQIVFTKGEVIRA